MLGRYGIGVVAIAGTLAAANASGIVISDIADTFSAAGSGDTNVTVSINDAADTFAGVAAGTIITPLVVKIAPFFTTDVITTVGYQMYRYVGSTLTADGGHKTTGIDAIPNIVNGYQVPLTVLNLTLDADGGYRGSIVWDSGGGSPFYVAAEVFVPPNAGFSLSSSGVQALWGVLTSSLTTSGSIGKRIADFLTGDAFARLGAPAGASVSADVAAVLSKTPDSAHFTNARGDKLDDLDATISSRLAGSSYTAPDNASITAIKAKTDNLTATPADETLIISATNAIMSRLGSPAGASVSADVAAVKTDTTNASTAATKLETMLEDAGHSPGEARFTVGALVNAPAGGGGSGPSAATIAAAVVDQTLSGHTTAGTVGGALSAAGTAGDPWTAELETGIFAGDMLRGIAAEAFGKTSIQKLGNGQAIVTFRDVSDSSDIITGQATGSERTSVTFTP